MALPQRKSSPEAFSDAKSYYTDTKKGVPSNINQAPYYPTIDGDFSSAQYDPQGINQNRGIANVQTTATSPKSRFAPRPQTETNEQLSPNQKNKPQSTVQSSLATAAAWPGRSRKALKIANQSIASGKVVGKANARFQVGVAYVYTGFINFLLSWFSLLAVVFLGGVGFLAALPAPVEYAAEVLFMGYTSEALWVLFAVFYFLQLIMVVSMFGTVALHLKAAGIKTTSGSHAGYKKFAFAISFVLTSLPGLPLFVPFIYSWLLVMQVYPD
ncbi:MAG: hypothetical protein RLZZ70_164 [Candidatus Parcubacteria bacterium]|jgi:hypothetical protein